MCYVQETDFRSNDANRLKVKGCKKIFHANSNQKRAGGRCTDIRQGILKDKNYYKTHRRTSIDKNVNPLRR